MEVPLRLLAVVWGGVMYSSTLSSVALASSHIGVYIEC